MRKLILLLLLALLLSCNRNCENVSEITPAIPGAPPLEALALVDSISNYGITWKFDRKARVGRFVNGDYYVIGPVRVIKITPEPANDRNGSVLNLPPYNNRSGFDSRIMKKERYAPRLRIQPPFRMKPGDMLVSTISVETVGKQRRILKTNEATHSPVAGAAILTCLDKPLPKDAFRPTYCKKRPGLLSLVFGAEPQPLKIYLTRNLRRDLLPGLPRVIDTPGIEEWAKGFQQPWLDVCYLNLDAPVSYMPDYGREIARAVGVASLLLMLDFLPEQKESLLINFVQYGIDLWGMIEAGHPGWTARGGHGNGRKWPVVFAGILLEDKDMQNPYRKYPNVMFSEDMQTIYGNGWTGATALYAGHEGNKWWAAWGERAPYEHLSPKDWPGKLGEAYRRCCTSLGWVGIALATHIMHAERIWNHDAFFDYVDRWMTEDDTQALKEIRKVRGWDFSAGWSLQRQTWDPFVNEMWTNYRNNLPPSPVTANKN